MATDATPKPATVLHSCRIGPRIDSVVAQSLPVTFLDIRWLYLDPIKRLIFYEFPCSRTHFLENIVPNFINSLSNTLKHYVPLAGHLIYPPHSGFPTIQFQPGDSVPVTVAESSEDSDFSYLTGNQPRNADEFYALIPDLPKPDYESGSGSLKIPLFALQITLFSNAGISVGLTNHHAVGDASSIVGFIKNWSAMARTGGNDEEILHGIHSLPLYDRSVIKDPTGLMNHYWNQMKTFKIESLPLSFLTNKVRATFILQKHQIQDLRNSVRSQRPNLSHVSSFTTTSAYVWTCLAKSRAEAGEVVDDNEPQYFVFSVDARARMDPPVPASYFGNCLGYVIIELTHKQLKEDDGFLLSAELIGETIKSKVNNKEEFWTCVDHWLDREATFNGKEFLSVSGSPKFDLYDTDFGWGKAKKCEVVSIDDNCSMSLCKSRQFDGGLEIGLSLSKKKMEAFAGIFSQFR